MEIWFSGGLDEWMDGCMDAWIIKAVSYRHALASSELVRSDTDNWTANPIWNFLPSDPGDLTQNIWSWTQNFLITRAMPYLTVHQSI